MAATLALYRLGTLSVVAVVLAAPIMLLPLPRLALLALTATNFGGLGRARALWGLRHVLILISVLVIAADSASAICATVAVRVRLRVLNIIVRIV